MKNTHFFLEYCYINYSISNEYYQSLKYIHKTLDLFKSHIVDNELAVLSPLNTAGIIHKNLDDYPTSLKYFRQCLQLVNALPEEYAYAHAYICQNISQNFHLMNQYDSAAHYLNIAMKLQQNLGGSSPADLFNIYTVAAYRQAKLEQWSKAKIFLDKAHTYISGVTDPVELAFNLKAHAIYFAGVNKYDMAIHYIDSAAHRLLHAPETNKIMTRYPSEYLDVQSVMLDIYEKNALENLATPYIKTYTQQADMAIAHLKQIILSIPSDALKNSIIAKSKPIYRHAIHAAFLSQNSRSPVFTRNKTFQLFAHYYASLIDRETNLQDWLQSVSKIDPDTKMVMHWQSAYDSLLQLSKHTPFSMDPESAFHRNSNTLFRVQDSLRSSKKQLRQRNDEYNSLQSQLDTLSNREMNSLFALHDNLLFYFHYFDEMFICHVTSNNYRLIKINYSNQLKTAYINGPLVFRNLTMTTQTLWNSMKMVTLFMKNYFTLLILNSKTVSSSFPMVI